MYYDKEQFQIWYENIAHTQYQLMCYCYWMVVNVILNKSGTLEYL